MSAPESGAQVFVSHSSQDNEFTQRLVNDLRTAGVGVWVDAQGINDGDLTQRINDAFLGKQWLILVLTTAALRSPWVQAEVNAALVRISQGTMRGFIPVIAGGVNLDEIPALWAPYHRIDARVDYPTALHNILVALHVIADDYVEPGVITVQPYDPRNGSSTDQYPLASALARAEPGDRLMLLPGLYRDTIYINKPIEIIGRDEGSLVILAPEGEHSIEIRSPGVRFSHVYIWIGAPKDVKDINQGVTESQAISIGNVLGAGALVAGAGLFAVGMGAAVAWTAVEAFGGFFGRTPMDQTSAMRSRFIMMQLFQNPRAAFKDTTSPIGKAADRFGKQMDKLGKEFDPNTKPTVLIEQGAEVFFDACVIRSSQGNGMLCSGHAHITGGKIHGCRYSGIVATGQGKLDLEQVEIGPNIREGVRVAERGRAQVNNCLIMYNRVAIVLKDKSSAVVNGNTLSNNRRGAWEVDASCAGHVQRGHNVE